MNPSVKHLVCFAMEDEARAFRKLMGQRKDVGILVTGIGRNNSLQSLGGFLQAVSPRYVFTCGFAGGLDPQLRTGDVLCYSTDDRLLGVLAQAGAKQVMRFHSAPRIVTTAKEKAVLWKQTEAALVEMESEAIVNFCSERKLPCAMVRAISDTASEDLPLDFNLIANEDQSLNYGKLALAIAKSPGKISALLQLQKKCKVAAERMANVLRQVVDANLP